MDIKTETYKMYSRLTGKKIRTATKVILVDGEIIKFMEKMTKREALKAVELELARRNSQAI